MINELKLNVNENCNESMQYKNTMESNIKEENIRVSHKFFPCHAMIEFNWLCLYKHTGLSISRLCHRFQSP